MGQGWRWGEESQALFRRGKRIESCPGAAAQSNIDARTRIVPELLGAIGYKRDPQVHRALSGESNWDIGRRETEESKQTRKGNEGVIWTKLQQRGAEDKYVVRREHYCFGPAILWSGSWSYSRRSSSARDQSGMEEGKVTGRSNKARTYKRKPYCTSTYWYGAEG